MNSPPRPDDARCDAILAYAVSRTAATYGMNPEDVNANVLTHPSLGRTIVRVAWEAFTESADLARQGLS